MNPSLVKCQQFQQNIQGPKHHHNAMNRNSAEKVFLATFCSDLPHFEAVLTDCNASMSLDRKFTGLIEASHSDSWGCD